MKYSIDWSQIRSITVKCGSHEVGASKDLKHWHISCDLFGGMGWNFRKKEVSEEEKFNADYFPSEITRNINILMDWLNHRSVYIYSTTYSIITRNIERQHPIYRYLQHLKNTRGEN